jgi:hypothetical protein
MMQNAPHAGLQSMGFLRISLPDPFEDEFERNSPNNSQYYVDQQFDQNRWPVQHTHYGHGKYYV